MLDARDAADMNRGMFAVLFEVQIKPWEWDRYLELAATLRPELVKVPGFIHNERYSSERTECRLLSVSLWESEKAVVRWRTHGLHHEVQDLGRFEVFDDYHLRVGEVIADSASGELRATRSDVTEVGVAKAVTMTEVEPGEERPQSPRPSADVVDTEHYTGITTEGKRLLLASWRTEERADAWLAEQPAGPRYRQVRIVRDYGLRDRAEAPQYFAPVEAGSARESPGEPSMAPWT